MGVWGLSEMSRRCECISSAQSAVVRKQYSGALKLKKGGLDPEPMTPILLVKPDPLFCLNGEALGQDLVIIQ